jgi:hypothetical protein
MSQQNYWQQKSAKMKSGRAREFLPQIIKAED